MLERWSVLFFLILFSSVVQAQKDVVFGLSQEYDWGVQTDIAINNNGDVVEVHKTNHPWPELQSLWFRTGKVQQMAIVWNGDSEKYDKGIQPSVALNDYGTIVEIHQSDNPAHKTIWYRVGNLSNGESKDKGKGITPSIAIDNSNWCVEVHQSQQKGNNGLWYSVGNVNGDKIEWGEDEEYHEGSRPQVAMNNNGVVVEVHNSTDGRPFYMVGIIDKNAKKIHWGGTYGYWDGKDPTIAITDDGMVIETHSDGGNLVSTVGMVNTNLKTIGFPPPSRYDTGQTPSVACTFDGSMAIQSHLTNDPTQIKLYYSTSLLTDRSRWMGNHYKSLQSKQLWQITLPGSHDSGAFGMSTSRTGCGDAPEWVNDLPYGVEIIRRYATAQNMDIASQLNNGCRYFDIRPYYSNSDGKFYAHHDVVGADCEVMLDQISRFLQETKQELVILNISHFCNFGDNSRHNQFVNLIDSKLNPYLVKEHYENLLTAKFSQLVGSGSRAIVIYNNEYINGKPGYFRSLSLYDEYANTSDYEKMKNDQIAKLNNYSGNAQQLFLFSWTLTFRDWESLRGIGGIWPIFGDLQGIASAANCRLGNVLATVPSEKQINVIFVDFLKDARVTDCAIMRNQRPVCPSNVTVNCEESNSPENAGSPPIFDNANANYKDQIIERRCINDYTIERTWPTKNDLGIIVSCTQSIKVVDNKAPVITCPPKITINCDESQFPARTGQATATDNCGIPAVTYSDQKINERCTHEYTINRIWMAKDTCVNTSTCLQQINVEDKKPPAISCPPNITVTCDTTAAQTGVATAIDNCDPVLDISRKDAHVSGYCEWACITDRHWQAMDDCGNTSKCVQRITKNTAPLLESVLPITLGNNNTTLTIPAGKADCIIKWMPYSGTTPGILTSGKSGMSPDCIPAATKLDANGRLIDPLVGEALKLSLLVKLNPALGTRKLSSFPGYALDPILKQALAPDPDVNELLRVTNLNLGATMVIWSNPDHAMLLLNLFKHINGPRDVCNP